jgi:hypothetical protein
VQPDVIPRGLDPLDLLGTEKQDLAARSHDDASGTLAVASELFEELLDESS